MKTIQCLITTGLLAGLFLVGCGKKTKAEALPSITIKGSDTMLHLSSHWAEDYMGAHPGVNIAVTGGGSGTGLAALLNGTTDICIASRKIKPKEISLAEGKGMTIKEIVTARDGIAVIINPNNPVTILTIEQIGKIYTGAYTNWAQVGGPDMPVVVLSRESSSGTYVFFQERVLNKKDYTRDALLLPSTSAIIVSVEQDRGAIGYVGLGYALEAGDGIKMVSVKDGGKPAVRPSILAVQRGDYAIARPLQFYINGEPTDIMSQFIQFVLSDKGQEIVLETGYVPIN